jgi:hypothetical protein
MLSTDDIVAATQVLQRVHHLIDDIFSPHSTSPIKGRAELMAEVFTEDLTYDLSYRGLPVVRSLEELNALSTASYARDAVRQMGHHATNIYIYEDEDGTVRAASKVISIFAISDDLADGGTAVSTDFHDVLVRTDRGWRIKERVAVCRWPNPRSFTREDTLEAVRDAIPG